MVTQLKSKCPHCLAVVKVAETHVGKRVRCPACKESFEVSSVEIATAASMADTPLATETVVPDKGSTANASLSPDGAKRTARKEPSLSQLGRFELKEVLGQGAFGRVYRAYDPQLDRFVALKVPTFGPDEKHKINRFLAEAKAAARLRHPNIVPTYESGQIGERYFIAAQFVAGQPLSKRLKEKPPDFRQAAEWVRQLAEALAYAHKQGIVHRDIKPDNIMIDEQDLPQIMDFGLAKRVNEDAAITTDGSVLGTPAYMAPEQARGDLAHVGPHSDQYSLGVVLYELLTGQKPFEGSPHAVIARVIGEEPRPPRSLRREISRDLEAICQKAMSKEIKRRYDSIGGVAADLARWLRGDAPRARPISWPERIARWCRREPVVSALATAVAVLLVLGVGLATTMAWIRAKNANDLRAVLADLQEQNERAGFEARRASEAEKQAEARAAEAIAATEQASANERLAESRAAELQKALDDLKHTQKLADERGAAAKTATAAAQKSDSDRRFAEYQIAVADAAKALTAYRYEEAQNCLERCALELRDSHWSKMHEEAVSRRLKLVPNPVGQPYSGLLQITRDASIAIIDNDKELRVVSLEDQVEHFSYRHPREGESEHIVACHGGELYIVYKDRLVGYDLINRQRRPPMRPRVVFNANGYLPQPLQSSLSFSISAKSIIADAKYEQYYAPFLYSPSAAAGVTLYDKRITSHINFATGQCGFGAQSMYLGPGHVPASVIAIDEFGQNVLYEHSNGDWYFSSRQVERGAQKVDIPRKDYRAVYLLLGRIVLTFADRFEVWNLGSVLLPNPLFDPKASRQNSSSAASSPNVLNVPVAHQASAMATTARGYFLALYENDDAISVWQIGNKEQVIRIKDQRGVESMTFDTEKHVLGWLSDEGIMTWRFGSPMRKAL